VIWEEVLQGDEANSVILYRTCSSGDCGEVVELSGLMKSCGGDQNSAPSIAINNVNTILVTWESDEGNLAYMSWDTSVTTPISEGCALSNWDDKAMNPRIAGMKNGEFVLVFDNDDQIFVAKSDSENGFGIVHQENGRMPEVFVDTDGTVHTAWCGLDNQIQYLAEGTITKTIPSSHCINRPVLGQDKDGTLHLLWYADQAERSSGKWIESDLIYESRLISSVWSTPNIVDLAFSGTQPAATSDVNGEIHLIWGGLNGGEQQLNYSNFRVYECDPTALNTQSQLALEVAQSGNYRPKDDLVPYCQNQFDNLLMLPKTNPAYSENPATLNGAFDDVAALIQQARYEVLLSTMWYESDDTGTSPGHVLGQGVKALYDKVKANPEQYPRGITVRILLDNPPEFTLSNLISQVWNTFNHMRYAGLPTMSDPEIGWKLEIANFDGSWPHGHTKMVVIDGKTAVAAGFNYQHKHQSKDHPSGKGKDDYDLGLQMTGPVAQTTSIAFDDLWSGSHSIVCPDLGSDSSLWWISCRREVARADHVPEVKKLFLGSDNSNAFALHRTTKFQESDQTVPTTIASAQKTLDVLQVNFTLALICDLNVLFEVCDFRDALVYMQAMMDAIEANNVKTRVLVKPGVIEGVESDIAVKAFRDALALRGLSDLVEFRYFQDSVHAKAVLIDDQFLVVGSQNFHYSAYGDNALTEFNIGTDDPNAITAFKRFFDYHWERAEPIPVEE
jgi:phosphatidylserine/phosphatidylglycerophosphate/cardiolipin synthase-like enzyme